MAASFCYIHSRSTTRSLRPCCTNASSFYCQKNYFFLVSCLLRPFVIKTISHLSMPQCLSNINEYEMKLEWQNGLTELPVATAVIIKTCVRTCNTTFYIIFLAFFTCNLTDYIAELQPGWRSFLILYISLPSLLVKAFCSSKSANFAEFFLTTIRFSICLFF